MAKEAIGEVYAMKLPNGYKIYQWAYEIPKEGKYIRVFDGLYQEIPQDIEKIVNGPHSYIIAMNATAVCRRGLAQRLGNIPVPEKYPYPNLMTYFTGENGEIDTFVIQDNGLVDGLSVDKEFHVRKMSRVRRKYRTTLINGFSSVACIMRGFDLGFDLDHPEIFELWGETEEENEEMIQKYVDMIDAASKQKK